MWLTIARYTRSKNKPTRLWWEWQECTTRNIAASHYFWPQKKSHDRAMTVFTRRATDQTAWLELILGCGLYLKVCLLFGGHYNSLSRIVSWMPKQILWSKPNRRGCIVSGWETIARLDLSLTERLSYQHDSCWLRVAMANRRLTSKRLSSN